MRRLPHHRRVREDAVQGTDVDLRIAQTFAWYERAVEAGDRADVAAARLALCLLLERSGWQPPGEVRDQMWRDRKVLREHEQGRGRDLGEPPLRPPSHRPPGSPRAVVAHSAAG